MTNSRIILRSLRPLHWVKNLLVLAPVFFSGKAADAKLIAISAGAFVVFCAAASAGYLFNDIFDADADRADKRKKLRPLAAGLISAETQWKLAGCAMIAAAAGSAALPKGVGICAALYLAAMALYSVFMKRFWPAGAALISLGMIIRIFAGASAIDVCVSRWVLPCTFFLTAFVVSGKRIYDTGRNGDKLPALIKPVFISTGLAALGFYIFYSLSGGKMVQYHTRWLFATAVPVAAGLIRYMRLVFSGAGEKEHFQAIVSDWIIIASLAAWWGAFLLIIYF